MSENTETVLWEPPVAGDEADTLVGSLERLRRTLAWKCGDLDAAGLNTRLAPSTVTLGGLLKHLALVEDEYPTRRLLGRELGPPWDTVDWDAEPDWEWTSAASDTPEELYALWEGAVARSRTHGRVRKVPPGSRRLARPLAALSGSPAYAQYAGDPPPCEVPHQTPRALPCGQTALLCGHGHVRQALAEGGPGRLAAYTDSRGEHPSLRGLLVDLIEEYARHVGHADMVRESVDGRVGEDPPR
ncbi:DUF664 domain-containing protein [Streptomyces sp. NPDC048751]|uniref:mycothiol transferase n=1 Tax=Streptomyces sp. NPDC048751 TaxID=3365591 RepID=UPI00371ED8A6